MGKLWAVAFGAFTGALIYSTGKKDGQDEGLAVGRIVGAVEATTGEQAQHLESDT